MTGNMKLENDFKWLSDATVNEYTLHVTKLHIIHSVVMIGK